LTSYISAPETAFWDQFKGEGGLHISKGLKNRPSQTDLITFNPSSPIIATTSDGSNSNNNSKSPPAIDNGDTTFVQLPYQNEVPLAGTPSKKGDIFSDYRTRRPSTQGIHHQELRPYGLEGCVETKAAVRETGRSKSAGKRVGYVNSATINRNPISDNGFRGSPSDDRPRVFVSSNPILNTEKTIYVSPTGSFSGLSSSSSSSSSSPQQLPQRANRGSYNRPLSDVVNVYST